jgi:hypothetical protein
MVFRKRCDETDGSLAEGNTGQSQSLLLRVITRLDEIIRKKDELKRQCQRRMVNALNSFSLEPDDYRPGRNREDRGLHWDIWRRHQGEDMRPLERPPFRRLLSNSLK